MTPKEKAKELYDKYEFVYIQNYTSKHEVKQCALLAVDEIILILEGLHKPEYTCFDIYEPKQFTISEEVTDGYMLKDYFEQVKAEIEKL